MNEALITGERVIDRTSRQAILLLAHGSPDRVEEIPEYLRNVTGGRTLPEPIVHEVEHRYSLIGHSPLTEITLRQAEGVSRASGLPVYVGMRNWRPYIGDTVRTMAEDGVTHAVVICLAPHNSRTSVGLYARALSGSATSSRQGSTPALAGGGDAIGLPFTIDFVESWHDHPLLIKAFAQRLREGWQRACAEAGSKLPVIFTAHSVPLRTVAEGDPYEVQTRETAALVAASVPEIAEGEWRFAFQSQGMSGGEWLGPTVEETILGLKAAGQTGVFVQPIGFVCDHVEILYDIDIAFRRFAQEKGLRLWRAESLNDSPAFIQAVAALACERLRHTQASSAPVGDTKASAGDPGGGQQP
ncbi:MAG: ferrochelatase [Candidatus Korobacteraceae bacterium]